MTQAVLCTSLAFWHPAASLEPPHTREASDRAAASALTLLILRPSRCTSPWSTRDTKRVLYKPPLSGVRLISLEAKLAAWVTRQ